MSSPLEELLHEVVLLEVVKSLVVDGEVKVGGHGQDPELDEDAEDVDEGDELQDVEEWALDVDVDDEDDPFGEEGVVYLHLALSVD